MVARILSSWAIALEAMEAAATAMKTEDSIVEVMCVLCVNECSVVCAVYFNLSKV